MTYENTVEFGVLPEPKNRSNTEIYNAIANELREHPGQWGKCAEVVGATSLYRWTAAMKNRGFKVSQRKVREDTWAVWCMCPEDEA